MSHPVFSLIFVVYQNTAFRLGFKTRLQQHVVMNRTCRHRARVWLQHIAGYRRVSLIIGYKRLLDLYVYFYLYKLL